MGVPGARAHVAPVDPQGPCASSRERGERCGGGGCWSGVIAATQCGETTVTH